MSNSRPTTNDLSNNTETESDANNENLPANPPSLVRRNAGLFSAPQDNPNQTNNAPEDNQAPKPTH